MKQEGEEKHTLESVGVKNSYELKKVTHTELICLKAIYGAAMATVVQPHFLSFAAAIKKTTGASIEETAEALQHLEEIIGNAIHDNGLCPDPAKCEWKEK